MHKHHRCQWVLMVKAAVGGWVGLDKPHYERYHNDEWGVPVHNDQRHFEILLLEGAQAGLNWETISFAISIF